MDSLGESISLSYGPILPDIKTREEVNLALHDEQFFSVVDGTILPYKKPVKKITFSPKVLKVEGDGSLSVSIESSSILTLENS